MDDNELVDYIHQLSTKHLKLLIYILFKELYMRERKWQNTEDGV